MYPYEINFFNSAIEKSRNTTIPGVSDTSTKPSHFFELILWNSRAFLLSPLVSRPKIIYSRKLSGLVISFFLMLIFPHHPPQLIIMIFYVNIYRTTDSLVGK